MSQQRNIKDFNAVLNTAVTGTSRFPVIIDGVLYTITRDELAILFQNNSIADGSVTTAKLANNAVTAPKIANGAVTTSKIENDAVTDEKLATDAVTTSKIENGAVTRPKLANNAVTEEKLATNAVTEEKLAKNAVTEPKIANGAVTEEKLATDAVTAPKIANGAVTAPKIANGAVTLQKTSAFIYGRVVKGDAGQGVNVFRGGVEVSTTFTFDHSHPSFGACIRIQLPPSLPFSGYVVATSRYNPSGSPPLPFTTIRTYVNTTGSEIFLFLTNSSGGTVSPTSAGFFDIDFIAI